MPLAGSIGCGKSSMTASEHARICDSAVKAKPAKCSPKPRIYKAPKPRER